MVTVVASDWDQRGQVGRHRHRHRRGRDDIALASTRLKAQYDANDKSGRNLERTEVFPGHQRLPGFEACGDAKISKD